MNKRVGWRERTIVRTLSLVTLGLCSLTVSACGSSDDSQPCNELCPAAYAGATVVVTVTPAMAIDGVQAILNGPVAAVMSCQANGDATLCTWPTSVALTAGTYSLQLSAPGYQAATSTVEVAVASSPSRCHCLTASIQPSTVSLGSPAGG